MTPSVLRFKLSLRNLLGISLEKKYTLVIPRRFVTPVKCNLIGGDNISVIGGSVCISGRSSNSNAFLVLIGEYRFSSATNVTENNNINKYFITYNYL
jgi:hypothetical protein